MSVPDSRFDTVVIVDWSGGNDTGQKPRKDAIWAGLVRNGQAEEPTYLRNRVAAEGFLAGLFREELAAGRRVFAGFDFPFGYPRGFAGTVSGRADPLRSGRGTQRSLRTALRATTASILPVG